MDFKQRLKNDPYVQGLIAENNAAQRQLRDMARRLEQQDVFNLFLAHALGGACANPPPPLQSLAESEGKNANQLQGEAIAFRAWCAANALTDLLNAKVLEEQEQREAMAKAEAEKAATEAQADSEPGREEALAVGDDGIDPGDEASEKPASNLVDIHGRSIDQSP